MTPMLIYLIYIIKYGNTASDEDIKQYINNKINRGEINSYYTQHLDEIKP